MSEDSTQSSCFTAYPCGGINGFQEEDHIYEISTNGEIIDYLPLEEAKAEYPGLIIRSSHTWCEACVERLLAVTRANKSAA